VLGYPRPFAGDENPTNPCAADAVTTVPIPDEQMLNTFADELASSISGAVATEQAAGVNIHYINTNPGFSGHEICSAAPWINGIVTEETSNAGTSIPGTDTFHPTAAGQQEFATLVNECLAGTLPSSAGTC
jgi:lysophospholipase L1-like esterase